MKNRITRRQFQRLLGCGAASIAAAEYGLVPPAKAEESFTVASTGASWGEGVRASFIEAPKFEDKNHVKVTQDFGIDAVITAKAMARCGNPPFSTINVLPAEGSFLGLGGCVQDYDLDICKNYKDILESAKEPPRGGLKNWFAGYVLVIMGLVYNTNEVKKPTSFQDLLNPKYKGRVGIPAYSWVGNSWLQVLNKTLGGNEDNIDPGIDFLHKLVTQNQPVVVQNADDGLKVFTRGEVVIMPYWNGRTHVLQSRGVSVDIAYVPGTMLVPPAFLVLKGGKFIEQTNHFCNLAMDGEYEMLMTKRFFYPPANRTVKLPSDLERIAFPSDKEENIVHIDYQKMNKHKSEYLDRWNKEVLGA